MKKIESNKIQDLHKSILEAKNEVENQILTKINKCDGNTIYYIEGNLYSFDDIKLITKMMDLGICDIRRLKRYLNKTNVNNPNTYNRLFYFICKNILNSKDHIKIYSPKIDKIQKLKKEWIELRNKADKALLAYKKEKGNFYKINDIH